MGSAVGDSRTAGYTRHLVPIGAAILVIAYAVSGVRPQLRRRRKAVMLTILAAVAVGNYTDFGHWTRDRYVNGWEFFHYYLGSKYAPELGYTELYAAALVADEETGRKFAHEKDSIRDLTGGRCARVVDVLKQRDRIVARFSRQRWTDFTQDVTYFKGVLSQSQWNTIFHDKGFNATPVWSMIVGRLTNWIETSDPIGLLGLALLDPLLIVCAIFAVWRTFDYRSALLMIILIGTHMTMSHSHMKGALLRTDWVMALVAAVCALKANRPAAGGALAAYAATSRVFPAIFAFGLFAKLLISWVRGGPPRRTHLRFAAGFLVTLVLLVSVSLLVAGPGYWQGFAAKIWQHNDSFSPWRVGFKHLFLGAYEFRPDDAATHQEVFHNRWALWWTSQALVLIGFVYLTRRLKDWETLALGFVPTFFLVAPTYYYYMMLVIPLLFFCGRANRSECVIGILWLLVSSSIAYVVHDWIGRELQLFYILSLMIFGVCLLMGISALLQTVPWRTRP
ncbi:MAG: hypothetical protein IIC02_12050, partial [Planctomycetes bacterium]|nr:hypothetical protein [Planctomycetota bacterium]